MGIKKQPSFTWSVKGIMPKLLFDLHIGNRIDIDGNHLAYKLFAKSNFDIDLLAYNIALFLRRRSEVEGRRTL